MESNVDNPFISPAVLSLCPGMLGLERGLESAIGPIRTVAYVEIEAFIIENLVQQMEKGVLASTPVFTDVKTFPFGIFRNKIHWIIGGYPCQPFSHAGTRAGADDPRHLWPFIKSGIKKSRPVGVWFENVEGHLSLGLRDVLADLRKLGYQIEVGIFSAAEVGAPHRRNRVFILGLENSFLLGNGRRYIEDFVREREIQTQGSGKLDHTGSHGLQPDDEISARRYCAQPAGVGQEQHSWESPRLESSLGYAANGYNFREDLLRMAGNAVVSQTAELGFGTLIRKFL